MTVFQIFRAECGGQIALLLQNLQVQHDNCKNGEQSCHHGAEKKEQNRMLLHRLHGIDAQLSNAVDGQHHNGNTHSQSHDLENEVAMPKRTQQH